MNPSIPSESPNPSNSANSSTSPSSLTEQEVSPPPTAGIIAGFSKALATRSVFLYQAMAKTSVKGTLKGALKYYIRSPIRFFRPVKIDHYYVVRGLVSPNQSGRVQALEYAKVVTNQGPSFVFRQMLPLLLVNSLSGVVLFQTYEQVRFKLENSTNPTLQPLAPFLAGFAGGYLQAFITTPVENLASYLSPEKVAVEAKDKGIWRHATQTVQQLRESTKNATFPTQKWYRQLFSGLFYNSIKDAFGFSVFFGTFELIKQQELVQTVLDKEAWYIRGVNNLLAGACAGVTFQLISYPFEVMRPLLFPKLGLQYDSLTDEFLQSDKHVGQGRHHHPHKHWLFRIPKLIQTHGIGYFYQGVTAQAVKAIPVSAFALVVLDYWASEDD